MLKKIDELIYTVFIVGLIGFILFVVAKYIKLIVLTMVPLVLWVVFLAVLSNKGYGDVACVLAIISVMVFFGYCFMNPSDGVRLNEIYPQKSHPPYFW